MTDDHEPTPPDPTPDPTELHELAADGHTRAELRHARRAFLLEAAMEAERDTGRREQTDEEVRHSLWMRVARLVGGWILVLLGLAAIPLPGPGWLMVLLGLTLLPYRWTDQLIRTIRRRIPGIPEDGRIPTRTWVITGVLVVAATAGSFWWGLRDDGSDSGGDRAAAATTTTAPRSPMVAAASEDAAAGRLALTYASVAAEVDDAPSDLRRVADPCAELRGGRADVIVPTLDEATACFGGTTPDEVRAAADAAGAKVFAPVTIGDVTYLPTVSHARVAVDDEPTELAIDGVTGVLNDGAAVTGEPRDLARELMRAAGVLK